MIRSHAQGTAEAGGRGWRFQVVVPDLNRRIDRRLSVTVCSSMEAMQMLCRWLPHEPRAVLVFGSSTELFVIADTAFARV